jgi:hypothetical protein
MGGPASFLSCVDGPRVILGFQTGTVARTLRTGGDKNKGQWVITSWAWYTTSRATGPAWPPGDAPSRVTEAPTRIGAYEVGTFAGATWAGSGRSGLIEGPLPEAARSRASSGAGSGRPR